jgi:CTP:molybdopterin cytidylyltransferase MocA
VNDSVGSDSSHIHVVVLAAGASTRFGSAKQLVRVNGRPLMLSVVSRAVELAGHSVTVVLGATAPRPLPSIEIGPKASRARSAKAWRTRRPPPTEFSSCSPIRPR